MGEIAAESDNLVRHCMRHPTVETRVSCATCSRPLCPKCMIFTPVGIKCKDCAQMRRPAQYTITPRLYARIIPGAVVIALGIGWLLSYVPYLGFIGGIIVGVAVSAALKRLSGYKQGREMEIIACATVALVVVSSSVFYVARALGGHWSTASTRRSRPRCSAPTSWASWWAVTSRYSSCDKQGHPPD